MIRNAFTAIVLAALIVGSLSSLAWAAQPACLAGDLAESDIAAIAAIEIAVAEACDCESFDGSEGNAASDYRRCVSTVVRTAVHAETLRSKCKGRVAKAYKASTCGQPAGTAPCIEVETDGDVRCRIRTAEQCVDVPGRFDRLACAEFARCVDAADDSGDYVVSSADSGSCRLPATTTSTTAEPTTTTLEPTTTTLEPTTTTTLVEATTTTLEMETTTTTLEEEPTTTLEPTTTTTTTLEEETTTTSTTTTTLPCVLQVPTAVMVANEFETPQHLVAPPNPAANNCNPQTLIGGGCAFEEFDGTVDNFLDARGSYVPGACPGTTLAFHWELFKPPTLSGTPYASSGISGYRSPFLSILPSSFPTLSNSAAGTDTFWRVRFTVTATRGADQTERVIWFRFGYLGSSLTLQQSTDCQAGRECYSPTSDNGRPPTEPT